MALALGDRRALTRRLQRGGPGPDLRPRAEELTARVVEGMVQQIPAYAHAPPAFRDVVADVVGRIVDQVVELFLEQRHATRHEVRDVVALCVPPVEAGVSLEDMLDVFRVAQDVLWWALHELVDGGALARTALPPGATLDQSGALDLGHLGTAYLTALSNGVASAYVRGDRMWLASRDAEAALLSGLLATPARVDEATRAARALDLRVHGTWQVAVYEPTGRTDDRALNLLDAALERALGRDGRRGARWLHEGQLVLALARGRTLPPPPPGARAGSGGRHDGPHGMRTSHDEALESLTVARARDLPACTIEQARLGRLLLGTLTAAQLADEVLAPLDGEPPARARMLFETLETWLDVQGNATASARQLDLHPQSARYRVEQLRDLFGAMMDDPEQRLQLHVAVKARHLQPAREAAGA